MRFEEFFKDMTRISCFFFIDFQLANCTLGSRKRKKTVEMFFLQFHFSFYNGNFLTFTAKKNQNQNGTTTNDGLLHSLNLLFRYIDISIETLKSNFEYVHVFITSLKSIKSAELFYLVRMPFISLHQKHNNKVRRLTQFDDDENLLKGR